MERFLFGWHFLSRMNSLTVTEPLSDLELLEHWSKGDRKAGAVLFRRQQLCLRMFFTSKAGVEIVEDLVQQVWVELGGTLRRQGVQSLRTSMKAYLLGIARHVLFRWLRERYRNDQLDPIDSTIAQLDPSLSQVVGERLAAQRMTRALQQLPLDTQVLLEFRYIHEMTVPDIAVMYDTPEGTIKSRLARARDLLEQTLGKH